MNEEKIFSLLVKMSADILNISKDLNEFKESTEQKFKVIDNRFDTLEAIMHETIDQLEEIEAKNIDRHNEMQKLINQNTTDISKLKKAK